LKNARMEGVVTSFTEGDQIGRRITAALGAESDVVDVESFVVLDSFLAGLAAIAIAMQDVGLGIVKILLIPFLVIYPLHGRVSDLVDVEGGELDFPPGDREDGFDEPAFAEMALDFGNQ
jgi:hypothetical protein